MKEYTRFKLIDELETSICKIIKEVYKTRWDENKISFRIAQLFAETLNDIEVSDYIPGFSAPIKCSVYENKKGGRGSDENKFGDIGIYVKIKNHNNIDIEGVSFLEAKKSYKLEKTNVFKKIKPDQMERIFKNAPYSFLLLYGYQKIIIPDNSFVHYWCISKQQAFALSIIYSISFILRHCSFKFSYSTKD